MSTIPASQLVSVNPSVIAAGGTGLDAVALMLTTSVRPPIGSVQSFPTAAAASAYFGAASQEAGLAATYFAGFDGSNKKPGALLAAQYPQNPVGAYLRGGPVALTLAQLQALNALLSVTIDAVVKSATVNLAAATSFSNAAMLIASALAVAGPQAAVVTGSIATSVLTVTAVTSGVLAPGQTISGTGVTAGTYISAQLTSTEADGHLGGKGTYSVVGTVTASSTTITAFAPAVFYDSISSSFDVVSPTTGATSTITFGTGALATSLALTQATGAVLSQGAIAAVPATFMNAVVQVNSSWVNFFTAFDPDVSGNSAKQAFAAWKNTQNNRFGYVCWDVDQAPTTTVPASSSLGVLLPAVNDSGTCLLDGLTANGWGATAGPTLAAFVAGAAASIDFTQAQGRITFAYKAQAGISANVTDAATAANLQSNNYDFYGAYGAATANFVWFQDGRCTGPFAWFDAYVNQIWMNNSFQLALLNLLKNMKSIPYNTAGNSMVEAALGDPIQAGLNFGAFAPGTISASQTAAVNAAAGANIAPVLQTRGWYLQILPASSAVRAARGSPPCTFWYLDRGSIQKINLGSVAVQ